MQRQERQQEPPTSTGGSNWGTEKGIKARTDPTKAALMFTSTVPTHSTTHLHVHTETFLCSLLPLNPSFFRYPFFFFLIAFLNFMCVHNPSFGLSPHCSICLLKFLYCPVCPISLATLLLQTEPCAPWGWREAEKDEENQHGERKAAAAPAAVSMVRLLTWQPAPPLHSIS